MSQHRKDETLQEALRDYERADRRYKRSITVFFVIFFAATAGVLGYAGIKMLPNPLEISSGIDKFAADYTDLKKSNEDLKKRVSNLEAVIAKSPEDINLSQLETRVGTLEKESKNIADTILEDPDRAISTRLLREKQVAMDDAIKSAQLANVSVNSRLDGFLMTLVAAPIIGAVLAAIGTLVMSHYSRKKQIELQSK